MADDGFDVDTTDLRAFIQRVKDVEPKLATDLRRELRRAGDAIIARQRQELKGTTSGSAGEIVGGVDGLRQQIAAGLRTRIVAGTTRQGVQVKTTGPRNAGFNMAKVFQKRTFRHPVFGRGWADQDGQPYFFDAIRDGTEEMRDRIRDAIEDTIRRIG